MKELTKFQTLQQSLDNASKEFQKSQRRLRPDSSQRTVGVQNMATYGSGLQDTASAIQQGTFTGLENFTEG